MQNSGKNAEILSEVGIPAGLRVGNMATQAANEDIFRFEGHTLDLRRGCLRAGDREIELRPKSFEMLRYLVENAGRLIPKEELIKALWPHTTVADESLTRCMSDVRQALGDDDQRIIKTLPRRGYLFAPPVSAGATESPVASARRPRRPVSDSGSERPLPASMPLPASTEPAAPLPPRLSLVVLPFINLSGDPAQDYIADVITEGLTAYLSRIRDSFVIARTTAFTYKGKAVSVKEIGRELGVRYVLEGSAQQSGTQVRVSAQLVDADNGAHLWADQFDADRADLLQMQDAIITRLARALEIELAGVEAARISRSRPASLAAEDMAVRGEAIFLAHGVHRGEAEAGFELCERALEIDPNNVRALSILADRFATRVTNSQSTDCEADIRRADELASRALRSDSNSYHAHQARARVLLAQGRPEEALAAAQRSLKLNPGFIPAYRHLCTANLYRGRAEETIDYADKAVRLSPFDPYLAIFHMLRGAGCFMLHRDDEAIASFRRAVADNPEYIVAVAYLAAALALTGQEAEAHNALKRYFLIPRVNPRTLRNGDRWPIQAI
jgi:TolB-like protein/DNA-binding winged helix-turn-helix (wHTH) protein/Tfp pilus assembly protein PilF